MILQHCHKHSGFSLIELIIAIAIFGVIATVAAPNFQSWSRNYQLKSASNDLYSHMQIAKLGAVKGNIPWTVNFNQNGIRGYNIKDGSGKIVKTVDFGTSYNNEIQYKSPTSSAEYDSATITFNPNGTSNSGFAYVSNKAKSGYYKVGLSFSNGFITLQKWNGSQWK
jgi:prepilin-type N-terminal cleavage/methylation domain-containing protein